MTTGLPDDPAMPGLTAIRTKGLARSIPALGLDDGHVELTVRGYSPGARITLEARTARRRFAVKAYAHDPADEAALYETLGEELARDSQVRVPPLLAWSRDLKVLAIGWLEGPEVHDVVKNGGGARAGALAGLWIRCSASLGITLGRPVGRARILRKAAKWIGALVAASPELGSSACDLGAMLARGQPTEDGRYLVHGSLYSRHLLDLGHGVGLIDWERFGRGPLEYDAAVFLATVGRLGLRKRAHADEAAAAEAALLEATEGILDPRVLAWYRAAVVLRLASKPVSSSGIERLRARGRDWRTEGPARAWTLLREAHRLARAGT